MIREKRMRNQAKEDIEESKEGGSTFVFPECLKDKQEGGAKKSTKIKF